MAVDLKKDWPTLVESIRPDCDCESAEIVLELQRRAANRAAKRAAQAAKHTEGNEKNA